MKIFELGPTRHLVTFLLIAVISLAAETNVQAKDESSTQTDPAEDDYTPPEPKKYGATFNLAYSSTPDTLNPIVSNDTTSGSIHRLTVQTFASRSFEDPDVFEPRLAVKWKPIEGKIGWIIKLREGVQFHPVKPSENAAPIDPGTMTAYDAKFSFEVAMNSGVSAGHLRSYLSRIEVFEVLGKYTLKVVWSKPYFNAKGVTLTSIPIIPEDVYAYDPEGNVLSHDYSSSEFAEKFNKHWANDRVSGTGPYRLVKWDRGNEFVLERFESYYAESFNTHETVYDKKPKKPFMERIVLTRVQEQLTQYRMLQGGDLDRIGMPVRIYENRFKSSQRYQNGSLIGEVYDFPAYRYIGWNMRKPMFDDPRVRKALTHAIPRKKIIDEIFYGKGRITTGPFFFKTPAYDDDVEPYPYSLDRARTLLDEAGWSDTDGDGIREKEIDGETKEFKFTLLHYANSRSYKRVGIQVRSQLKRIGIDMTPAPTKWNSFLTKLRKRNFDACMLGWALGWTSDPYQVWHSSQAAAKGGSNHVGWVDRETDQLIDKIRVTMDREKRRGLYHKFHRIMHKEQPYTFLWTTRETAAHWKHIHSIAETAPSQIPHYAIRPTYDINELYVPKD